MTVSIDSNSDDIFEFPDDRKKESNSKHMNEEIKGQTIKVRIDPYKGTMKLISITDNDE